jgi:hypothetical protein
MTGQSGQQLGKDNLLKFHSWIAERENRGWLRMKGLHCIHAKALAVVVRSLAVLRLVKE